MESEVCVGGMTALFCWREARVKVAAANAPSPYDPHPRPLLVRMLFDGIDGLDLSALPVPTAVCAAPSVLHAPDARELQCLLPATERPLSFYVSEEAGRGCTAGACASILGGPFPEGSFCGDARGFTLPSPELLPLLLGRVLPFGQLLMVVAELTGFYVLATEGLLAAPPLVTVESIGEHCERLRTCRRAAGHRMPRGVAEAARVCALGLDGAASPAEAALAYLLCLPRELGGYGLPRPELNRKIEVGGKPYVCDLLWNDGACLLEYQGGLHLGKGRSAADMQKGNALRGAGCTLLEASRADIGSLSATDRLAGLLADALGCELASWSAEERAAQISLRSELLSA